MPATLTDALANVRSLIDEPVAQFWGNDELTNWLNQGAQEIQRTSEWKRKQVQVAATSSVQAYVAPSDLLRIYRLEFVPNNNTSYTYSLDFRGYNEMDAAWGNLKTLPAAYPELYTLWANPDDSDPTVKGLSIVLYPVPSVDGFLNIYYYPTITQVATGSDDLDILPGWEDTLYNYTAYRALMKDADSRYKAFQQMFMQQVEELKTVSRTYTDQGNFFSTGAQNYNPLFLDLDD